MPRPRTSPVSNSRQNGQRRSHQDFFGSRNLSRMVLRGRSERRKVFWAFVALLLGISLGRLVNQGWAYAGLAVALGLDTWIVFDILADRKTK